MDCKSNISNERLDFLDMARGIGILLVVIGHFYLEGSFREIIYYFHIPLFFVISGYLAKTERKTIKDFVKKSKSKIISYFGLGVPVAIADWIINTDHGFVDLINAIIKLIVQRRYTTMWFLACLIVVELLFLLVNKALNKIGKNDALHIAVVSTMIVIICSIYIRFVNIALPWNIDLAGYCLGYYSFGNAIKNVEMLKCFANANLKQLLQINFVVVICAVIVYMIGIGRIDIFLGLLGCPLISYTLAAAISFVLLNDCKHFNIPIICYVGRNTILLFAWHQYIFKKMLFYVFRNASGNVHIIISIVITVITSLLITEIISRTPFKCLIGRR